MGELHSLGKPVEENADYLKMTHLYPLVINTQMYSMVWNLPQEEILLGQLHSPGTTVEEIEDYFERDLWNPPVFIKTAYVVGSDTMNERDPAAAMALALDHQMYRNDAPALPKYQNDALAMPKKWKKAPAMPKKWNDAPALLNKQSTRSCSPSNHPRALKCNRHRLAKVTKKPTRRADRVLVKRALSPPVRRRSKSRHRRRTFRPTPSRLSKMSMA